MDNNDIRDNKIANIIRSTLNIQSICNDTLKGYASTEQLIGEITKYTNDINKTLKEIVANGYKK